MALEVKEGSFKSVKHNRYLLSVPTLPSHPLPLISEFASGRRQTSRPVKRAVGRGRPGTSRRIAFATTARTII